MHSAQNYDPHMCTSKNPFIYGDVCFQLMKDPKHRLNHCFWK